MESRKRPIDELLEEVRCMRSNLERMNRLRRGPMYEI
jgi:hypothetical protein